MTVLRETPLVVSRIHPRYDTLTTRSELRTTAYTHPEQRTHPSIRTNCLLTSRHMYAPVGINRFLSPPRRTSELPRSQGQGSPGGRDPISCIRSPGRLEVAVICVPPLLVGLVVSWNAVHSPGTVRGMRCRSWLKSSYMAAMTYNSAAPRPNASRLLCFQ